MAASSNPAAARDRDGARRAWLVAGAGPAEALLHPAAFVAIGLLLVNDHLLKAVAPGFVTGKLSDIGGLAFFPLLLLGAWELVLSVSGRWRGPSARPLIVSVAVTAIAFVLVKTTVIGAAAFGAILGVGQWAIGSALSGGPLSNDIVPALVVADPTDLVALPALLVAAWIGHVRVRTSGWRP